jgi:hypothetical protein
MKFSAGIQKFLSFGYLFLVVLGILKESLFYYPLGIHILNYSTIMDVLLSPVADLTSHPVVFIAVAILVLFSYFFPVFLARNKHRAIARKMAGLEGEEHLTEGQIADKISSLFAWVLAASLFSFFIGMGYGGGRKQVERIKKGTAKYDRTINFTTGEREQVFLIGSNSVYYFYVSKDSKIIKIAPVGTIKSIELTHNKMIP